MSYHTFTTGTNIGGKYAPNWTFGINRQKYRWKRWSNATGSSLFIPENTQSERISVHNHLQNVAGITRVVAYFGSASGFTLCTAITGDNAVGSGFCESGVPRSRATASSCPGGTTSWPYGSVYGDALDTTYDPSGDNNPYYNYTFNVSDGQPNWYYSLVYSKGKDVNGNDVGNENTPDSYRWWCGGNPSLPYTAYTIRHCYITTSRGRCWENCGTELPAPSTVEYLVVAGGGGGSPGPASGGGGGAGGFRTGTLAVGAGTYAVTVGAGGSSSVRGSNSVFSSITSTGGGEGAGMPNNGGNGGSGGGGAEEGGSASSGGTGIAGQGNDGGGGTAFNGDVAGGGGGGGANAVGGGLVQRGGQFVAPGPFPRCQEYPLPNAYGYCNGDSYTIEVLPNGGAGLSSSISGSSVTYAGGGGGGVFNLSQGSGGSGGGGNAGSAGGTNTGGGGGGARTGAAGAGGSGIVIIRHSSAFAVASVTGSPTVTASGGYITYIFTGSGSVTW